MYFTILRSYLQTFLKYGYDDLFDLQLGKQVWLFLITKDLYLFNFVTHLNNS